MQGLADPKMQKFSRLRVQLGVAGPDDAQTHSTEVTAFAGKPSANYSRKGHDFTPLNFRSTVSGMSVKYRTAKRRALLTRAIRDTFGVQLQSVHANGTRCVTALLSVHATVVSILAEFVVSTAFIFFNRI